MRLLLPAGVASVIVATSFSSACSSGGGGGTLAFENPGVSKGSLSVIAGAACIAGTADVAGCQTALTVYVRDSADNPVDGALVEMGPHGQPLLTLGSAGSGSYYAFSTGFASGYDVNVSFGANSLTGVTLVSPKDFSMTLDPDPPAAGSSPTLRWTPFSNDALTAALAEVIQNGSTITFQDQQPVPDNGAEPLTAAFPTAGSYQIQLARGKVAMLAGNGGGQSQLGVVSLARTRSTTVP